MDDELRRVVVVTGAAGGIGLGVARAFRASGARVVLADIDEQRLEEAVRGFDAGIDDVFEVGCDVRSAESMVDLRDTTIARFGRVDVVCLNAGGPIPRSTSDLTRADWERDLGLNLFGAINGVEAFLPAMEEEGRGHLNVTASMSGLVPFPPVVTYNVAKAGLIAYVQTLAHELGDRESPVGVSVSCPGEVATYGVANAMRRAQAEGHRAESGELDIAAGAQEAILEMGMDADDAGRVIQEGIDAGRFWIFTHPEWVTGPLATLHQAMTD